MLALTTKAKYGLEAILALAAAHGQGLLQIREVAARQAIPRQYLVLLMNGMAKAGLVTAVRGQRGGYALARAPEEITVLEVFEALDGPLAFQTSGPRHSVVQEVLAKAEADLRKILGISLAEILRRQKDAGDAWGFQI